MKIKAYIYLRSAEPGLHHDEMRDIDFILHSDEFELMKWSEEDHRFGFRTSPVMPLEIDVSNFEVIVE